MTALATVAEPHFRGDAHRDLGGRPVFDIPGLALAPVVGVLALAAASHKRLLARPSRADE